MNFGIGNVVIVAGTADNNNDNDDDITVSVLAVGRRRGERY